MGCSSLATKQPRTAHRTHTEPVRAMRGLRQCARSVAPFSACGFPNAEPRVRASSRPLAGVRARVASPKRDWTEGEHHRVPVGRQTRRQSLLILASAPSSNDDSQRRALSTAGCVIQNGGLTRDYEYSSLCNQPTLTLQGCNFPRFSADPDEILARLLSELSECDINVTLR